MRSSSPLLISFLWSSRQPPAAQVFLCGNFFRYSGHGRISKPLRSLSACTHRPAAILLDGRSPWVNKRLHNRISRHYGKYQRSVRSNSAFDNGCVLEMTVFRWTRMEATDEPFTMSYELMLHSSDAVHSSPRDTQHHNSSASEPIITAYPFCHAHHT